MIDIERYEHTGEELLDRLDELRAAETAARFYLELFNEKRLEHNGEVPAELVDTSFELEHAAETLRRAHEGLDELFDEEYHRFPIETVEVDENGHRNHAVTVMEADVESYQGMVEALSEIAVDLTDGDPGLDYSEAPSPIAMIDYSDQLINAYRRLEDTYDMLEEAGV